jgi:HlyD family secretion protein
MKLSSLCLIVATFLNAGAPCLVSAADKTKAVGTIEPAEVVDVGAQVAGMIASVNVDYGSRVEMGDVLATIGNERYAATVDLAKAATARAEGELALAKTQAERAAFDLKMLRLGESALKELQGRKDEFKSESARVEEALVNCKTADARVAIAAAALAERKSKLRLAELDLSYTTIRSPVKGTVIDRRVNKGQSVDGKSVAPGLFLIGDIEKLQVWASVREADIGKIRPQQAAQIKVDCFPDKVFAGTVMRIRPNAMMLNNTVTYTVVIAIADPSVLKPYLTAEVEFK